MEEFQFLKQYLSIESSELFFVPEMIRAEQLKGQKETDYKKAEHEKYKRVYENMSLNFIGFARRILKR